MKPSLGALVVVLLWGATCETLPARTGAAPSPPPVATVPDFIAPTPGWPLKVGTQPGVAPEAKALGWVLPSGPGVALGSPGLSPGGAAGLPLPTVVAVPAKVTAPSRSWGRTDPPQPQVFALPTAPAKMAAQPEKNATGKVDAKAKAPVPAAAQPVTKPTVTPVPTPAATATLLPEDKTTGQDFHWQDVNAVAGDLVTLHFEKTNWLYLDPPAQQKTLGFQSISRDKDATTFQFKPTQPGNYVLDFQRQDLVNQNTDFRKVRLTVVAPGTRTSGTGTVLAPQTSTQPADDALEASRRLAASGKTSEAVQKLLQSYKADDARTNLELARLLSQDGQDDQALSYLDKNLTLPGPDFQGSLELGTQLATKVPQTKLPAYVKQWLTGTQPPPEELYLQVFEALKTARSPQTRDWVGRYAGWYPAPRLKDRYLFQLGQLLEEPGEGRDVRGAWKAYDEVVRSFPLSPYWKAAGERASYLNRHFLQVR